MRLAVAWAILAGPGLARADDGRFAQPPSGPVLARGPAPSDPDLPDDEPDVRAATPRAPVRVELGPRALTTGRGVAAGGALDLAFGAKVVGARVGALWLGGEGRGPAASALAGVQVEVTVDGRGARTIGPVLGLGVLALHASSDGAEGWGGAGTARAGVEWALPLDADVRATASVGAGVLGPRDRELAPLRAFALAGLGVAVGF